MNIKKFTMWLFVLLTIFGIYMIFNHRSIPLLYAYLIYPFVCSLGFAIAGLIGRGTLVGRIILMAVIISFSMFLLIVAFFIAISGAGIVYWGAGLFFPVFTFLLVLGFLLSGIIVWSKREGSKSI